MNNSNKRSPLVLIAFIFILFMFALGILHTTGDLSYVSFLGVVSTPSPTPSPSPSPTPRPTPMPFTSGYVRSSSVNLRREPDTESSKLGNYKRGTVIKIYDKVGEWYKVSVDGINGYMYADYISTGTPPVIRTTPKPTKRPSSTKTSALVYRSSSSSSRKDPVAEEPIGYTVYITRTGEKYHRSGCRYLSRSKIAIDRDEAISRGYTACKVCRP